MFREVVHGLFFQKMIRPKILQAADRPAAIDAILTHALPKVFGYLDSGTEQTAIWRAARFSIADIAHASNLINYHYLGYRLEADAIPRGSHAISCPICSGRRSREALAAEQPMADGMGLDRGFQRELQQV